MVFLVELLVNREIIRTEEDVYTYDNLPGYEYVDVKYDTYRYVQHKNTNPKCRYAQKV